MLVISELLTKSLLSVNELNPIKSHLAMVSRSKSSGRYSVFQAMTTDLVVQASKQVIDKPALSGGDI